MSVRLLSFVCYNLLISSRLELLGLVVFSSSSIIVISLISLLMLLQFPLRLNSPHPTVISSSESFPNSVSEVSVS